MHVRSKLNTMTVSLLGLVVAITFVQMSQAGSLTPPGAPAPTMKTLAEVEPRTPI